MNCWEVNELFVAFLDGEVNAAQRESIQAHLDRCGACKEEFDSLSSTRLNLRQYLQSQAAQAVASAQSWEGVQARLAEKTPGSGGLFRIFGRSSSPGVRWQGAKFSISRVAVVLFLLAVAALMMIPEFRAQAETLIARLSRSPNPVNRIELRFGAPPLDFELLQPDYLPAGVTHSIFGEIKDRRGVYIQAYLGDGWFIQVTQTKMVTPESLPPGQVVNIKGQPAVLADDLEGIYDPGSPFGLNKKGRFILISPTVGKVPPEAELSLVLPDYTYNNGKRITWYAGEVEIEIFTNLPEQEALRVAESMTLQSEGDQP